MTAWARYFAREIRQAGRQVAGDGVLVLAFLALVLTLFPLAIGPERELLARLAPGILWSASLLATLLSLEPLFARDYEDGTLDQLALFALPLESLALARILAHWLTTGAVIAALTPLLGALVALPREATLATMLALALGTPALSALGATGSALILGARRGGLLLIVIVLPLFVPVLIFGAGTGDLAAQGQPVTASLLILTALSLAAVSLCPLATAAALRQALQ